MIDTTKKNTMPGSVAYIVGNEAAERFSFYGMRAILVTFLVAHFYNPMDDSALTVKAEAQANETVHFFIFMAYGLPIVGAFLADWFWGRYKVIMWFSLIYCLGHAMLAIFEQHYEGFYTGLILVALGAGGVKPNASANLGDQFTHHTESIRSKAFELFYFGINTGSFLSMMTIPWFYANFGPAIAFGIPGIFMGLSTWLFYAGRKKYVRVEPKGFPKANLLSVSWLSLKTWLWKRKTKWVEIASEIKDHYGEETVNNFSAIGRVLRIFAFIPIFWALYDQSSSEWVLQARNMDRLFLGIEWLPEQIQAINAVLILVYVPLFSFVLYPLLRKIGLKVTPLRKISLGFVLTICAFLFIAVAQEKIDAGQTPGIIYQIVAYTLLTAGEVMISLTGLEYAFTQSPKSTKSTITAIWLLTNSLGNLLVSRINASIAADGFFARFEGAAYFWLFVGIISVCTVFFIRVTYITERKPIYSTSE
ncbi:MFS transporter [Fulvivirgaceae bacterium BMA10]|uniref:MFS transporter n=1 Tax=Splendidivirga corallicola TaxID=3051826 RepID=A0ABT8KQ83_9BACT|nr:MFS transporter [Fulvivirgaceae bacterium BMA10]